MGPLDGLDYGLVALFAASAFVAVAGVVLVAGFLPRDRGPEAGRGMAGALAVYGAALTLLVLLAALLAAATALPVAVAVIAAGLAVLAGPFAVDPLPGSVRNSRGALVAVAILSVGAAALLPTPFF